MKVTSQYRQVREVVVRLDEEDIAQVSQYMTVTHPWVSDLVKAVRKELGIEKLV